MSRPVSGVTKRLSQIIRMPNVDPDARRSARVTAFVARFIVLREGRRSRAHRVIEKLEWGANATAEEIAGLVRDAFVANGDKLKPVDRDIKRALEHANYSADYFNDQFSQRVYSSFQDGLVDYQRSNRLLFGDDSDEGPRSGGWRLPVAE